MNTPAATPLFIALAVEDPFFAYAGYGLIDCLRAAKLPVEFHLFGQNVHNFSMHPKSLISTDCFGNYITVSP